MTANPAQASPAVLLPSALLASPICVAVPLQAHTLGLVDDIGLQRVVTSALADLRWARARYAYQVGVDWDRVVRQLNRDIKAANDFLPDDKQVCTALEPPTA